VRGYAKEAFARQRQRHLRVSGEHRRVTSEKPAVDGQSRH
jgi:hypothetical protein